MNGLSTRAEAEKFYTALGHDGRGGYYFRNAVTGHIVAIAPRRLRIKRLKLLLISLAPLHFWERAYPGDRPGWPPDWTWAYDALLRQAQKNGAYSPGGPAA